MEDQVDRLIDLDVLRQVVCRKTKGVGREGARRSEATPSRGCATQITR